MYNISCSFDCIFVLFLESYELEQTPKTIKL